MIGGDEDMIKMKVSDRTNIKISTWTKDHLEEFKDVEQHTTLDSVIRSLLERYRYDMK